MGRDVAGMDPGPRRDALSGWLASIDAVGSVGFVGEWRPAGRRVARCSWQRGMVVGLGGAVWLLGWLWPVWWSLQYLRPSRQSVVMCVQRVVCVCLLFWCLHRPLTILPTTVLVWPGLALASADTLPRLFTTSSALSNS